MSIFLWYGRHSVSYGIEKSERNPGEGSGQEHARSGSRHTESQRY